MQDFFYRKLKVYQDVMVLLEDVYQLTKKFPSTELHGLTNQIQRAAVSIPSNIAEGMGRFSIKDEELQIQDTKIATIAKMVLGLRKNLEEKINNNTVMSE